MLNVSSILNFSDDASNILRQLLPHLKRLHLVNISRLKTDIALLNVLHEHPRVTTVVVLSLRDLPPPSVTDLKVVVTHVRVSGLLRPSLTSHLTRNVGVARLTVQYPEDFFGERPELSRFSGLRELDPQLGSEPVSPSRFFDFASTHTCLRKIRFWNKYHGHYRHTLPFLLPFFEELDRRNLGPILHLKQLTISRTIRVSSPGGSLPEWHVSGLSIIVNPPLDIILPLVSSSFPKISSLTLQLKRKASCHIVRLHNFLRGHC